MVSCRPIALLNTAHKLATKIIHNRLYLIINKISCGQAGFRSRHSTVNKIKILNNIVKKKLLQSTNLKLPLIDFQKAFNSAEIARKHLLSNLDNYDARLNKYRDILPYNTLIKKVKRQLTGSIVLVSAIYNLESLPLSNTIKKKLNFLTRKIKSILSNVPIQEYKLHEGDLDIQQILLKQRLKYIKKKEVITVKQVHSLREFGLGSHLEPKDPKYIAPSEMCQRLGLVEKEDIQRVVQIQDPSNRKENRTNALMESLQPTGHRRKCINERKLPRTCSKMSCDRAG
eukprot:augustus_masked-scaffold_77-processed-gene-0.8-mRNA-1 protein AED:1.00 eAED:1.00 QI:0/0/0/0/1/1/2/0/284